MELNFLGIILYFLSELIVIARVLKNRIGRQKRYSDRWQHEKDLV